LIAGITFSEVGQGPDTALFLHGIGTDARCFHHQLGAFEGIRSVAWNMPGYRGSQSYLNPPTFDHLSDRLTTFISGLGGPVHLIGQSIGGMLALHHAIAQPNQIKSLTLVATTPRFGGRDDSFKEAFLKARLGSLDAGQTMAEMASKAAPHLAGPGTSAAEIKIIEEGLAAVPEETWRGILQCLVTFDRADALAKLSCPVLVVAGSADQNAPARTMEKMATKIPDARFRLMNDGGHMLHQERPECFNKWLADFFKDVTS
jgi:3-oxoadipate enol-lactonase